MNMLQFSIYLFHIFRYKTTHYNNAMRRTINIKFTYFSMAQSSNICYCKPNISYVLLLLNENIMNFFAILFVLWDCWVAETVQTSIYNKNKCFSKILKYFTTSRKRIRCDFFSIFTQNTYLLDRKSSAILWMNASSLFGAHVKRVK